MGKVVIPLFDSFAIETYDGLVSFLEEHLELDTETVAQLPSLIRLAEYELDRMLTAPEREISVNLATTAGIGFIQLPALYRQVRTVRVSGYAPLSANSLSAVQEAQVNSGRPLAYAMAEDSVHLAPTPDAAYTVSLVYMTRIPPLSPSNQTNWLLSQHADAYLFAALIQTLLFQNHDERAVTLRPYLVSIMDQINEQGLRARFGALMTPRVAGVP